MYPQRLARLRELAADEFDLIALVPGPDLAYLTGAFFHLSSDRPLVVFVPVQDGQAAGVVPVLEEARLNQESAFALQTFPYNDAEGFAPAFERATRALRLSGRRVGVEGLRMRVAEAQLIESLAPGATVTPADHVLMQLRLRKNPDELAHMRRAIQISEAALDRTLEQIEGRVIGMTEAQIAQILLNALAELGGGENAFDPIVLTGANSALPHGHPGATRVQRGDLLLFDFGTKIQGYPSDITRTFAVGELSPELTRVYETVLAANLAGLAAGKPGVAAQVVDRAARAVIREAGFGDYFTHRTGHGLGLDIHEHPNMREGNTLTLEPAMVYTVEPGIYLPGKGGVRIEDDVAVTADGVEVMTHYPKALRTLKG